MGIDHVVIGFDMEVQPLVTHNRVATVWEKYLENEFFPGQGKVREFCGWSGKFRKDLESQGKNQGI